MSATESRYFIKTLGCKANFSDSQLIEAELQRRGWGPAQGRGDPSVKLCIVNSCTVTDEADRQSRKLAARLGRENPGARVVITGCAAEIDPERLAASAGIHYVVGNQDKHKIVDLAIEALASESEDAGVAPSTGGLLGGVQSYDEMRSRHPIDREWPLPSESFVQPPSDLEGQTRRARSFLKIQEGCNSFCTYCVIPYGRGPSRSFAIPEVVEQIKTLVSAGTREVILTGTNIGDYGTDFADSPQFEELISRILKDTQLERLRVSSLDPAEITPRLLEMMATEPRFCPHFHVSLQSPHSRVLRLMKRKYGAEQVEACLRNISRIPTREPGGVFVGMDLITGFPGETREEFDWGYEQLSRLPWTRLHVFPYSERAGTPATRLPGSVAQAEREARAHALKELSDQRLGGFYRSAMKESVLHGVLLENGAKHPSGQGTWLAGYTSNYLRVMVEKSQGAQPNGRISAQPVDLHFDRAAGDYVILARL